MTNFLTKESDYVQRLTKLPVLISLSLALTALSGCSSNPASDVNSSTSESPNAAYQLEPCPKKSNCVSSQETIAKYLIPAFDLNPFSIGGEDLQRAVTQILSEDMELEVTDTSSLHVKAIATSLVFRFKDDIEILIDASEQKLHFRSASRTGYYDFGVNRERSERFYNLLEKALKKQPSAKQENTIQ